MPIPFSHGRILMQLGGILCLVCLLASCQTRSGGSKKKAAAVKTDQSSSERDRANWNQAGDSQLPSSVGSRDSYSSVNTSLPFLALTFDDGPHPTHTPRLLDILKERNVKATFYVVGTNAKRYPAIMRRIVAEGHEVGNHTVTHGNLTKMSKSAVKKELENAHQSIVATTGLPPRTMRPPYGAITSEQKKWIRREYGYPTIMWSVDPLDWKKPGASVVTRRLVAGAKPGGKF